MFGEIWTEKELEKIREIKARPLELRNKGGLKQTKTIMKMLREVEGLSEHETENYIRRHSL